VREPPRVMSPAQKKIVHEQMDELIKLGKIVKSTSPYAANLGLVQKKDGSWRSCCDFRSINYSNNHNQRVMSSYLRSALFCFRTAESSANYGENEKKQKRKMERDEQEEKKEGIAEYESHTAIARVWQFQLLYVTY